MQAETVVVIHIKDHQYCERDGYDLYCAVPVSLSQAALGATITIKTLDEKSIDVKIPAGTPNGKILRVKNEGVPSNVGRKGDLYIKLLIQVPAKMTAAQRKLMEAYAAEENASTSPDLISLSSLSH